MTFSYQTHTQEKLRDDKAMPASDGASKQRDAVISSKLVLGRGVAKTLGLRTLGERKVSLGNKSGFPTLVKAPAVQKSGIPTGHTASISSNIDFDSLMRCELGDVLATLGKEHQQHKGKHVQFLYAEAGKVAAVAARLEDVEEWRQFCKRASWEEYGARYRPKIDDQKRLPFYVYLNVYGHSAEARADAHERYPAVEHLLTKKVPAIKIASELTRMGGFSGVDKKRRKKQEHQAKQKSDITIRIGTEHAMVLKKDGKRFAIEVVVDSTRGNVIHCKLVRHQAKGRRKLGRARAPL